MPDNIRAPERARALQMRSAARRRAKVIRAEVEKGALYRNDRDDLIGLLNRVPLVEVVAPLAPLDRVGQAS